MLALTAIVAGVLVFGTGSAHAADECRGLQVCLPVAGPWVTIPARAPKATTSSVTWALRCPLRGYIVAGLDARLSDRRIDVSFRGEAGSPVAPGVTTGQTVFFVATFTGQGRKATSFRPFIGCVPSSGGGGRAATAYSRTRAATALKPGRPIEWRVAGVQLEPGNVRTMALRCKTGDRLIGWSWATGTRTDVEPSPALLAGAHVTGTVRAGRVLVRVMASPRLPAGLIVEAQGHAVCARAAR